MIKSLLLKEQLKYITISACLIFLFSTKSVAYTVSSIRATYRSGQVFITWTNADSTHLQYNLYRSTKPIMSSSDLLQAVRMGYVRDSSSKNFRRSMLQQLPVFFKIDDSGEPLSANSGLYAVTCTDNESHYYAVTITDLETEQEDATVIPGENALTDSIAETVADPQPVWQDSTVWNNTSSYGIDLVENYVWFGNNQDLPNFPAMLNCGSYGYNFYIIRRGNVSNAPLYVFYEGLLANSLVGNGLDAFADVTNCIIIGLDDWLPGPGITSGIDPGVKTFWSGYHEDYDIYSDQNPIPTSGTIKTYSQTRYIHTIDWANTYLNDDPSRVYLVGVSAGGFGALLTAMIVPKKIAVVYAVVPPVVIKSESENPASEQIWGTADSNLPSDILNPNNGQPISFFDLMTIKTMFGINRNSGVPMIFSVSGKNDVTVGWKDKPNYFNAAETNDQGQIYFWDQREHDGTGANFLDSETMPDFNLYQTTKSFPSFANASSNNNPGNGDVNDGDPYGSFSGYLDWDSVFDQSCGWAAKLKLKTLYVGGVPDSIQYDMVRADVTIRRAQNYNPPVNSIIQWGNWDMMDSLKIQSGAFIYQGGIITIPGVVIRKTGNLVIVHTFNCENIVKQDQPISDPTTLYLTRENGGCWAHIQSTVKDNVRLDVYDLIGRLVASKKVELMPGTVDVPLPINVNGIYIATLRGASVNLSKKLYYLYY